MNAERAKVAVEGAVQGVGFRPFVYRLAAQMRLNGWVLNSAQGVHIEVEGTREVLQSFVLRLEKEKPSRAVIQSLESAFLDAIGYDQFEIRYSEQTGQKCVLILPDISHLRRMPPGNISIPRTVDSAIRSPTAPTAGRDSRSSKRCRTIVRTLR